MGYEVHNNMFEIVMFENINIETGGGGHHSQKMRKRGQK